jgi:hypothetical protein
MPAPGIPQRGLVGREGETRSLAAFLDLPQGGPAAFVLEGDPGIGKTALCATLTVTAPSEPQTFRLHVEGVSNQGTVKGNLFICMESAPPVPSVRSESAGSEPTCGPPQPYFRVISFSSSETASGSEDSLICDVFGVADQASGTLNADDSLPQPQTTAPPTNTLTTSGGFFQGEIKADDTELTFLNYKTHNCSIGPDGNEAPCDNTIPDRTAHQPDGVSLTGPQGANVKVIWPLVGANIGAVDDRCSVFFWNTFTTLEDTETSVPLTTFQTPGQHTITFSGSHHFGTDALGNAASIEYSWSFSLTFEVVDAPG